MVHTYDSIQVGDTFTTKRFISAQDVQGFADVTGDDNPIHLDPEHAKTTRFKVPVVHGVLLLGIVSKVLGRDYPGHGSIAVSMSVKWLRPVPVGSEVEIQIKVAEKIDARKHVRARLAGYLNGKMCLGGEAVFIPPES
ncbi:MAG: MaoC family dehydratase [Rhodothermia bacterium]